MNRVLLGEKSPKLLCFWVFSLHFEAIMDFFAVTELEGASWTSLLTH